MPKIRIPETYTQGLTDLANLKVEEFEAFTSALEASVPRLKATEIAKEVVEKAPRLPPNTEDILEVLKSLCATFGNHEDLELSEFVHDLIEAMKSKAKVFSEPAVGWANFEARLKRLLSSRTLRLSARADDVQHEETNVFTTARILTDIRPVFEPDSAAPHGALIIHNLKITYFHDGDYSDIYISLDNGDLKLLRAVLDRAERKTVGLKNAIEKADLLYFQAE